MKEKKGHLHFRVAVGSLIWLASLQFIQSRRKGAKGKIKKCKAKFCCACF
jgi:hypothetical protein